jgi:molybdopterin-guanine dinucleotide biosynthesis protein A
VSSFGLRPAGDSARRGRQVHLQGAARVGAILLAGGAGSRLGGVDKAAIRVGGTTLLDRALAALDGIGTVVVGPPRDGVRTVREDPPLSGPAAAVVAGLAALPDADEVLLLAVDLPSLPEALPLLLAAPCGPDGVVAVDPDGRTQWLLGRYRASALRAAAAALGDPVDRPLRALLAGLDLALLRLPPGLEADVDTVADARRAGVVLPGEET